MPGHVGRSTSPRRSHRHHVDRVDAGVHLLLMKSRRYRYYVADCGQPAGVRSRERILPQIDAFVHGVAASINQ